MSRFRTINNNGDTTTYKIGALKTAMLRNEEEYIKEEDVSDLVKTISFNNATRTLTLQHNDADENGNNATSTSVQIPGGETPDVSNLITSVSFDNATRYLTMEHNDGDENGNNATSTSVQIPHTQTPNVDNLVKNVIWDQNSRNLTIEKNSIYQTASILNIPDADLTNYYTQSQIDANFTNYYTQSQIDNKDYMENYTNIKPDKIKIQGSNQIMWDSHSDKKIWMQDSTWIRFNARIYTEGNNICSQGRIGAGTVSPGQPLHVAGKAYISSGVHIAGAYTTINYSNSQSDFLTNGNGVQADPPNLNFGIKCDQAIVCSYLVVTSDQRIKENIEDILSLIHI